MVYQMIYSSQANTPMSIVDLEEILVDARTGNEKRNVTGALVYIEGVFLQILEGEKETLQRLMKSIAADTRHSRVTVFHEGDADGPLFSNWRMAYVGATPEQMAAWAGLEGAASITSILQGIQRDPQRRSRLIENLLGTLAS
ncbi:MAG TPA: BLUF domain-containing protein [Burkholderiaceae bacterium]|nr:BLUF domain-containing protein [Burkholderiaceae bacterium]